MRETSEYIISWY